MKKIVSALMALAALAPAAWSQDRIYRCGNEYTNNVSQAREKGCKLVEGGNVTVVQGSRPSGGGGAAHSSAPAGGNAAASPSNAPRVDANDQRARDSDARAILEAELRKAEARLADVSREYNNGEPQRTALELRNPQVYIERTAELKAAVSRAESDVAGIKRELARLPAPAGR
ncbi:conserved hypothetical protein [Paracidovorax avenae ATCC 19860]|uniref:Uncharacterized protein n=1 Tax=Paracidovorax avenae (strain ATCC 19860 / DSM 7227 / CCUG 15838 / JCM 20985 / LMG 2117 / NCPPB 1011) TaxID=643561 RepID=F0Q302_PARA1|nr:hypothetical protein [Paracidovorax avenae]ADX45404.1 conserved hypothetical protein [Paracidovorax avenae ATCC 19860]AVS68355.1 hypothetical protein C8245_24260 [Paracidovorax avenae]AVS70091.1 hypothetical protein C8247_06295 [Paracidovorax avenae]AVS77498.1 hypothetical protein C8234_04985 [Paracidovorax avenae]